MKKLIEKLASNEWYCPCCDVEVDSKNVTYEETHEFCGQKILSERPIYIGDCLEVLEKLRQSETYDHTVTRWQELINLWSHCGLNKSLQTIEEESGYERVSDQEDAMAYAHGVDLEPLRLKDPNARALEEFLTTILL